MTTFDDLKRLEVIEQKKLLRREMRERLKSLSIDERKNFDGELIKKLLVHPAYQNATVVMLYLSMAEEVQLYEFISIALEQKKIIAVPLINELKMQAVELPNLDALELGAYGIFTVKSEFAKFIDSEKIDCVIVPGLAFDTRGYRLGRGGGFYDEFLPRAVHAKKIVLAYDFQIVENVPVESHDFKADAILTPTKIFSCV